MTLFTRDVTVCVLSSGSAGNATYIGDGHAGVLVDCGVSTKQILARLDAAGLASAPIDGVLLTHEHNDHVAGAAVLARALAKRNRPVPFFCTRGTLDAINPRCLPDGIEIVEAGKSFRVKHLIVEPIPVPHDVRDPVAYRVIAGDVPVAVITDLGRPTALVSRALRDCRVAVLEFNHDEDMLWNGPYSPHLKQRIRGNHGHLSNRQAAQLLEDGLGSRLDHLILAHLSEENNTPACALAAARAVLDRAGVLSRVHLQAALQHAALPPITVQTRVW
ncbi:MAG: MBL fold metallo-hydrolase [Myxococcales bacterium]|nr:MBL fold metallo-hydrolase [Myxococcales bacterium]